MRDPSRDTPIEAEIQTLIANGEFNEACTKAWGAYQGEIVTHCINALRGYVSNPEADGEELAQEILSEFSCKLPTYYVPSIASTHTYLFMITKCRVIDEIRTLKILRKRDAALRELRRMETIASQSRNPETLLLEREKKELLDRAVEGLEGNGRMILYLHLEGYSKAKIAHIIGKQEGNLRVMYSRMLAKIRKEIDHANRLEIMIEECKDSYVCIDHINNNIARHKNIFVRFWEKFKSIFTFLFATVVFTFMSSLLFASITDI